MEGGFGQIPSDYVDSNEIKPVLYEFLSEAIAYLKVPFRKRGFLWMSSGVEIASEFSLCGDSHYGPYGLAV